MKSSLLAILLTLYLNPELSKVQIVERHLNAVGSEAFKKVNSLKIEATISQAHESAKMVVYKKRPLKMRQEVYFGNTQSITVLDGDRGWTIDYLNRKIPLDQGRTDALRRLAPLDPLLEVFDTGKMQLIDLDSVRSPSYVLHWPEKEGVNHYVFINRETFLITQYLRIQANTDEKEIYLMEDYRQIEGCILSR